MLTTSAGVEPATSWSPVGLSIQPSHLGRPESRCTLKHWWKRIFSSPELKAQGKLLWSLTVRRRRSSFRPQSLNNISSWTLIGFWLNFTGMILGWSSFRFVQMVSDHCISRSQELKIDFLTKNLKNLLVRNHWTEFNIILQKCSFGDPPPRLFKPFEFVKKHGRQGAGPIFPVYLYRKL